MFIVPTWRLVGCVALLVPLSLLGAFARPLGYLSLGLAVLFLLTLVVDASLLLVEPIAQLRVLRLGGPVLEVGVATTVSLELTNRSHRALAWLCPTAALTAFRSLR